MKKIVKVARTSCDGFYLVKRQNDSIIYTFEGLALCPNDVKKYVEKNTVPEMYMTAFEAISYGYFK